MKIQSIKTVYFSATGNTKNVVKLIGETIARNMNLSYKEIDFTLPQAHKDSYEFTKEELVIFGTPVCGKSSKQSTSDDTRIISRK